ncbi:uncharacterized protein LOC141726810 [Zonotrichia albicollis]|uniref:uncharacterized protein LOC141726810 n=1 Tax=Zonotrichia albicollis TaxID=44394 RepID=UPI003D80D88D
MKGPEAETWRRPAAGGGRAKAGCDMRQSPRWGRGSHRLLRGAALVADSKGCVVKKKLEIFEKPETPTLSFGRRFKHLSQKRRTSASSVASLFKARIVLRECLRWTLFLLFSKDFSPHGHTHGILIRLLRKEKGEGGGRRVGLCPLLLAFPSSVPRRGEPRRAKPVARSSRRCLRVRGCPSPGDLLLAASASVSVFRVFSACLLLPACLPSPPPTSSSSSFSSSFLGLSCFLVFFSFPPLSATSLHPRTSASVLSLLPERGTPATERGTAGGEPTAARCLRPLSSAQSSALLPPWLRRRLAVRSGSAQAWPQPGPVTWASRRRVAPGEKNKSIYYIYLQPPCTIDDWGRRKVVGPPVLVPPSQTPSVPQDEGAPSGSTARVRSGCSPP